MPPHAGGEVVDAEQVRQVVGLGAALQPVQHGELAVQQRLVAAGDVEEDPADAYAQLGLADGGVHGGPLHLGERVGEPGDLGGAAGCAAAAPPPRRPRLVAAQPPHDAGQPPLGQLLGGAAQPDQLADETAGEPQRQQHRRDDRQQPEPADDAEPHVGVAATRSAPTAACRELSSTMSLTDWTSGSAVRCHSWLPTGSRLRGSALAIRSSIALKLWYPGTRRPARRWSGRRPGRAACAA